MRLFFCLGPSLISEKHIWNPPVTRCRHASFPDMDGTYTFLTHITTALRDHSQGHTRVYSSLDSRVHVSVKLASAALDVHMLFTIRNKSDHKIIQNSKHLSPSHLPKSAPLHVKQRYNRLKFRRRNSSSWASWLIGMRALESIEP